MFRLQTSHLETLINCVFLETSFFAQPCPYHIQISQTKRTSGLCYRLRNPAQPSLVLETSHQPWELAPYEDVTGLRFW